MSTRSQIRILDANNEFNVYHHYDGYFSGVGNELHNILVNDKIDNSRDFFKKINEIGGYEVDNMNHGDIEYFYILNFNNKSFKGYKVKFNNQIWKNNICCVDKSSELDLVSSDERLFK